MAGHQARCGADRRKGAAMANDDSDPDDVEHCPECWRIWPEGALSCPDCGYPQPVSG